MDGGYNFSSSMSLTSSTTTSLRTSRGQLMSPKSPPPGLLDFHGKRKQRIKVQVLEREIGLLQEELNSLEGLHPASICCKEFDDFIGSISDPFTPTKQTISDSHHFRKQISFPWICCSSSCLLHKKMSKGCFACCCSSSKSRCSGSSCLKTTTTSAQKCYKVVKFFHTPCACCLTCFACKCDVAPCSNCVENCCHTCCQ